MDDAAKQKQAHVRAIWEKLIVETVARNWDAADRLFNEVRAYAKAQDMTFIELHSLYAERLLALGEFEKTLPHLSFLRDIYAQLGVTDPSFLGLRGVPPFETYLELANAYLSGRPENLARLDLLESLSGSLDPQGRSATEAAIASLRAGGAA